MMARAHRTRLLLIGIAVAVLLSGMWLLLQSPAPSQAQDPPQTMRLLIEDLIARGEPMQFEFAEPIAPGFTFRESNGSDLTVGDDFACFSEPWNNGQRLRCTPFSNIVSISYID